MFSCAGKTEITLGQEQELPGPTFWKKLQGSGRSQKKTMQMETYATTRRNSAPRHRQWLALHLR